MNSRCRREVAAILRRLPSAQRSHIVSGLDAFVAASGVDDDAAAPAGIEFRH